VYAGAMRAYLGGNAPDTYNGSMRVTEPSRFFVLDAPLFSQAMGEWFPMAVHLLDGLFYEIKNSNEVIGQRERLLALGSLSAGLTHELNNPASAAVSATAALRNRVAGMRHKLALIAAGKMSVMALEPLIALQEAAVERVAKAPTLTPMEASDREDILGEWLEDHNIRDGWDLAPTFVQAGLDVEWLDQVTEAVPEPALDVLAFLDAQGFAGEVTLVSPRGLLPLPHEPEFHGTTPLAAADAERAPQAIRPLMRWVRQTIASAVAGGLPWQRAVDSLRPHVVRLYRALPQADRASFVRHVRPYWDVFRHRAPADALVRVDEWARDGRKERRP